MLVSGVAQVGLSGALTLGWGPVPAIGIAGLGMTNSTTIAATVVIVTGFVGRYGTEALAGYGLGSRLELMLVPIAFGIGGGLALCMRSAQWWPERVTSR